MKKVTTEGSSSFALVRQNFGGRDFVSPIPLTRGAPKPIAQEQSAWYAKRERTIAGRSYEWQFRTACAFRENPKHHCYWVTLTFRDPEPSWQEARTMLDRYLKRIRKFVERIQIPAAVDMDCYRKDDSHIAYVVTEEEGSENGRKHFHMLMWLPYRVPVTHWRKQPYLIWHHGFIDCKAITTDDTMGLAIYIAKYAHKAQGRTKCSSHFGLTIATTLLSISSFNALAISHPRMAQNLLRRLCLTPNYLTYRTLTYLALQSRSWITAHGTKAAPSLALIGFRTNGCLPLKSTDRNRVYSGLPRETDYSVCANLTRAVITTLWEAIDRDRPFHKQPLGKALPGLFTFGKPRLRSYSLALEPNGATAVWLERHAYSSRRSRIARRHNLPDGRPSPRVASPDILGTAEISI